MLTTSEELSGCNVAATANYLSLSILCKNVVILSIGISTENREFSTVIPYFA